MNGNWLTENLEKLDYYWMASIQRAIQAKNTELIKKLYYETYFQPSTKMKADITECLFFLLDRREQEVLIDVLRQIQPILDLTVEEIAETHNLPVKDHMHDYF